MNNLTQREQLLKESRRNCRQSNVPAIHPRYQSTCSFMYNHSRNRKSATTGIRIFISLLLFVLFEICDLNQVHFGSLNTDSFIEELQKCPYDDLENFSFPYI